MRSYSKTATETGAERGWWGSLIGLLWWSLTFLNVLVLVFSILFVVWVFLCFSFLKFSFLALLFLFPCVLLDQYQKYIGTPPFLQIFSIISRKEATFTSGLVILNDFLHLLESQTYCINLCRIVQNWIPPPFFGAEMEALPDPIHFCYL